MLASVRIWAVKGKVYSVTRRPLLAVDTVRKEVEEGRVADPGDLITAFATAITSDMDPDVANLGDELDGCEEQLDEHRVFQLRRTVSRVRVAAIGYRRFSIRSARRWRSWPRCPATGWPMTTGCTCPPPPTAPRAWPRSWNRSANARR